MPIFRFLSLLALCVTLGIFGCAEGFPSGSSSSARPTKSQTVNGVDAAGSSGAPDSESLAADASDSDASDASDASDSADASGSAGSGGTSARCMDTECNSRRDCTVRRLGCGFTACDDGVCH
jgi:hypothetical protein